MLPQRPPPRPTSIAESPTTLGITVARRLVLDGQSLAAVWNDGTLRWLMGSAVAYLLLGVVIFRWFERLAKRDGALGQY